MVAFKTREKLLIIFAVIAIAIFVFDRAYYAPQSHKILQFKEEIKAANQKMEQFLSLTKGVETVEMEVARLEKELRGLSERTLKGEEFRAFLRHLARESDALQMKIISLNPEEENLPLPDGKKENPASLYRKVTIQMVLHSTFTKLRTYLKEIEELPFFVNLDSLQIERNEDISPFLKVTIVLSMRITAK